MAVQFCQVCFRAPMMSTGRKCEECARGLEARAAAVKRKRRPLELLELADPAALNQIGT
jgi:hypothetical protein